MPVAEFGGVYVAIATPFTKDYDVDWRTLREHAEWLIAEGVDGLIPTGTCGEYASLTDEERARVVETVLDAARGKVPVVVGVAAPATRQVVHWTEHAREHGAAGVMALPPILYKPRWNEVVAHYTAIDRVGLPIVIYNNPHDTAVDLTADRLEELGRLPHVRAVKEFSQDIRRVTEIFERTTLEVIAGADDLVLECLLAGATGWIAGMANVVPKESVALFRLAREGRWPEAWQLYRRLLPVLRFDSTPRLVQAIKEGIGARGRSLGPTRPPRLPLEAADAERLAEALSALAPQGFRA
jgi:4-hydroxy-tetrahydrodipicolinate synthase